MHRCHLTAPVSEGRLNRAFAMIGLILVTHGKLAEEFRLAMEHVVGPQKNVTAICIGPEDDIEARRQDIEASIQAADSGDGVIVVTDMFGGTPSNLAISLMDRPGVEVLAGMNLPMLVKLAKMRGAYPIAEVVACAQDAGRKYIAAASHVLSGKTGNHCGCPDDADKHDIGNGHDIRSGTHG